jgi:hypothetical protein
MEINRDRGVVMAKKTVKTAKKAPKKVARSAAKTVKTKSPAAPAARKSSAGPLPVIHEFQIYANPITKRIPENQGPNYYCAIEAPTVNQLALAVQNKINEGWVPTGGLAHGANDMFVQALVRY